MQIGSIIQPTEIQATDFRLSDAQPIEKVESVKTEIQDAAPPNKAEQPEKLQELQSALAEHNITLSFSQDEQTNELVVKLVDDRTGEALRQFPSEVSLKLTAVFARLQGQFVDEVI